MKRILLGGSPCTKWSIAQMNNRETTAEGEGWELFLNYAIAKEKFKPDFFLYENNKSAAAAIKEQITKELGYGLTHINSALVSAQNRQRFYVTPMGENVPQPEDRGILLRDVLETGSPVNDISGKSHTLKAQYYKNGIANFLTNGGFEATAVAVPTGIDYAHHKNSDIVTTNNSMRCQRRDTKHSTIQGTHVTFPEGKTQVVSTTHVPMTFDNWDGKTYPAYDVQNGLITIKDKTYPVRLADGLYIIRKLTCVECERLQTMPDGYTEGVSNSQRYKMLGNGWTAEVIIHILREGLKGWRRDEPLQVLGMYDGMATGRYCLEQLGFTNIQYLAYEVDKYAIQIAQKNYPDIIQCGDAFAVREDGWRVPDYVDARLNALLGVE